MITEMYSCVAPSSKQKFDHLLPLHRFLVTNIPTPPQILAKAEFMNPGGSVKDRVAAAVIREGLATGQLQPGVTSTLPSLHYGMGMQRIN